jgi:hypothetical protein
MLQWKVKKDNSRAWEIENPREEEGDHAPGDEVNPEGGVEFSSFSVCSADATAWDEDRREGHPERAKRRECYYNIVSILGLRNIYAPMRQVNASRGKPRWQGNLKFNAPVAPKAFPLGNSHMPARS